MSLIAAFVASAQPMAVHRVLLSPSLSVPESSSAQPACETGGAAQPTWSCSSSSGAAQPTANKIRGDNDRLLLPRKAFKWVRVRRRKRRKRSRKELHAGGDDMQPAQKKRALEGRWLQQEVPGRPGSSRDVGDPVQQARASFSRLAESSSPEGTPNDGQWR